MKRVLLTLIITAQLSVPAYMIYRYESTLRSGNLYHFPVRPVDPYDPFRGRYVHLNFDSFQTQYNGEEQLYYRDFVYASITKGENGNITFDEVFASKPTKGDFLKVYYLGTYGIDDNEDEKKVNVGVIFNRYYSQESKALKIETAVAEHSQNDIDESEKVTAAVRIKGGLGVIEELYVGDLTIHEFLSQQRNKSN